MRGNVLAKTTPSNARRLPKLPIREPFVDSVISSYKESVDSNKRERATSASTYYTDQLN